MRPAEPRAGGAARRANRWRARIAAVAVLGLACAGFTACSSGSSTGTALRVERLTSTTGQAEVLVRPAGRVRGLVVFMHGLDNDQDQILDDSGLFAVRDALLARGYALVSSNAHGDNMGNPASVADQLAAAQDGRGRLGGSLPVAILAFSMGGLDALLTAASHRMTGLTSLALLSPAVDQRTFLDSRFADTIDKAFGNPVESRVPALLRASDPALQPPATYRGYRYHFWHSPDDGTVPYAQSVGMSRLLSSAGIAAPVSRLTGDHGDLSALDVEAVLDLVDRSSVRPGEGSS